MDTGSLYAKTGGTHGGTQERTPRLGEHTQTVLCYRLGPRLIGTFKKEGEDFPGGTVDKNPPANAGDLGSFPDPGRSHMPRSN